MQPLIEIENYIERRDAPFLIAEDSVDMTPKKIDWKGWTALGIAFVATVVSATLWLDSRFNALDTHIRKVEMAVRIVGAKQGGDTKALMDEALALAEIDSKAGRTNGAKSVLGIANNLLTVQAQTQVSLAQSDFSDVLVKYQALKRIPLLAQDAHQGMQTLAEYRTATIPIPQEAQRTFIGESGHVGNFMYFKNSVFIGSGAMTTGNNKHETDIDNMILENVVFRNANIVYKGGPIRLIHVKFINCRFSVPNSPQGDQLLEAAIEQNTSLQIG